MRVLTAILVAAGALWSITGLALWSLARSGPAAVAQLGRWLGLEPGALQWLGDSMALVGPAMQVIVVAVWALGMIGLVVAGVVLPRLARESVDVVRAVRAGERPRLDPELTRRRP